MKVTSTRSVDFPSLGWGITAGDVRELPADKEVQKVILAHRSISEFKPKKEEKSTN
jgi:hypothetical protein